MVNDYKWQEVTLRKLLDHAFASGGVESGSVRVYGLGEGEHADATVLKDGTVVAVGVEQGWGGSDVTPADDPEPRCFIGRPKCSNES